MQLLTSLRIPRCLKSDVAGNEFSTELHLFADASELAYGAACYVRLKYQDGTVKITFLLGKSRLAPIKVVTIPRLELCAAVLAAKMHESILSELEYNVSRTYLWSDSTTVLGYIRNTTARYKAFVANRVATIYDLTQVSDWHHIDGKLNPADIASRGIMPTDDVKLREWLQGPSFLLTDDYPGEPQSTETDTANDE